VKTLSRINIERKEAGKKSLVTYVTAGLPGWVDCIHACCENGADIVEVGFPFSDPIMDGPVISEASAKALAAGAKTMDLIDILAKNDFSASIAIMTYSNVLYVHGINNALDALIDAGVTGLILPDLTFESISIVSEKLSSTDLSLVQLVSSTTDEQRRKSIVEHSEGFIYCVAIKGITGQDVELSGSYGFIKEIRSMSELPTYCGVGIRTPENAKELAAISDGVIVGTSIVEKMLGSSNAANEVGVFVKQLREAIDS
jgi:tryptophan synthase alpha chain